MLSWFSEGGKAGRGTRICLVSWEWGPRQGGGEATMGGYVAGAETRRLDLKEKESTDLKIAYLSPWPPCFSGLQVPREGLLDLEAGIMG